MAVWSWRSSRARGAFALCIFLSASHFARGEDDTELLSLLTHLESVSFKRATREANLPPDASGGALPSNGLPPHLPPDQVLLSHWAPPRSEPASKKGHVVVYIAFPTSARALGDTEREAFFFFWLQGFWRAGSFRFVSALCFISFCKCDCDCDFGGFKPQLQLRQAAGPRLASRLKAAVVAVVHLRSKVSIPETWQ